MSKEAILQKMVLVHAGVGTLNLHMKKCKTTIVIAHNISNKCFKTWTVGAIECVIKNLVSYTGR